MLWGGWNAIIQRSLRQAAPQGDSHLAAKSPPVLAETLSWVQFSIKEEFGLGTVDTQAMLEAPLSYGSLSP